MFAFEISGFEELEDFAYKSFLYPGLACPGLPYTLTPTPKYCEYIQINQRFIFGGDIWSMKENLLTQQNFAVICGIFRRSKFHVL